MHGIARDIAETGGDPADLVDRFEELIPERDLSAYREQVQSYVAPAVAERNLGAVIPAFSGLDVVAEAAEVAGNDEVRQLADRAIANIEALEPEKSELRVIIDEAMERTRALAEERREAKLAEARREGDRIAALNEMPESARAVEQQKIREDIRRRQETVDWAALTERKRQEVAAAQATPRQREGQRFAAMNEVGYELGGAPAPAPAAPAPASRSTGGMPGDGTPSWLQRPTGELTSQRYQGPGGHGMGDLSGRTEAPEAESDDQKFLQLIELGISPDVAYNAVYGSSSSGSGGSGQLARPSAAEIEAANREDVEAFLRGQFGGFEFFLDKHAAQLHVGLTSDGLIVDADDPSAMTTKNVLDVIVEQGLTDPGRIEGALGHTEWWQTTDAQARVFDVTYENLNELERLEYVEPTMDLIREELQFLGAEMSDEDRQALAADLMRLGDQSDQETVRDMIIDRLGSFDPGAQSISDFAAARDEIEAMSRRYFVPIDTATAGQYAQDIYLGDRTSTQIEQYFKEHAVSKFPTLENAIKGGFTPEEYFAPYKYEIERMLGRPNINLYDEFADVIEYFPDTGGDQPRPMTMHEVRKYVRGLPEWQQSYQGQQSAEALAFAIGKTFGEVA
jgi:hypothetical protein